MLIRAGYDISFTADTPTPMMAMLSVHPSRHKDLRTPHRMTTTPDVPMYDYLDAFGNVCTRVTVPAGGLTLSCDFTIEDGGLPDPYSPDAVQHPIEELPDEVLVYLLASRYCETALLMDLAWSLFGHQAPGWLRVQAIVDYVHDRIAFGYHNARATRTAGEAHAESVGVCRDYAHLAVRVARAL